MESQRVSRPTALSLGKEAPHDEARDAHRRDRHLRAGPDAGRRATGRGPPGHPAAGRYACWSIRLLADTLACGVAARGHELAETLTAYARWRSSTEQSTATLLAGPGRADVALAALANVSAVRMFDANDIYCPPPGDDRGHFSDVIPALLAAAEVPAPPDKRSSRGCGPVCRSQRSRRSGRDSVPNGAPMSTSPPATRMARSRTSSSRPSSTRSSPAAPAMAAPAGSSPPPRHCRTRRI